MNQPKRCPAAEVEGMVKLQNVLLKAMAKKITRRVAADDNTPPPDPAKIAHTAIASAIA